MNDAAARILESTEHYRHTVIEAGQADEPATGGGATPPSFFFDVRLPLVIAAGSLIGTVALCIVGLYG